MWHYFWMGAFLWHSLFYAASSSNTKNSLSLNTKNSLSFKIELTSSLFPAYVYAFRALIFKKKQIIAWANYHMLHLEQAQKNGYDALITYLQAFDDMQVQKKISSIMIEGQKRSGSPLAALRLERKLTEVSLAQKRRQLLKSLLKELNKHHKEIGSVAVEVPRGYTKEEKFYKSFGFELATTFQRKSECSPKKSENKNYSKIDVFIKKLRE